ncbi:MAG TPA: hypothetical protein PKL52_00490 [Tenuifilaceae bacterium]|nr:hypothetical protein [Tenuifilaceae bacterium]
MANTSTLLDNESASRSEAYRKFWEDMENRLAYQGLVKWIDHRNNIITTKVLRYPIFDENGNPLKVVELAVVVDDLIKEQ